MAVSYTHLDVYKRQPYAGVQEGVAVTVCNDEVAVIASVGEAQEAFLGDVCEQLHVLGVVDEHAAVVGDGDAACRALAFGDREMCIRDRCGPAR